MDWNANENNICSFLIRGVIAVIYDISFNVIIKPHMLLVYEIKNILD